MQLGRDFFGDDVAVHSDHAAAAEDREVTDGEMFRVAQPVADVRLAPDRGPLDRQMLYGHPVWRLRPEGQVCRDETTGYCGRIAPEALGAWINPTHRVSARATLLFAAPDIKTPAPLALSCGSLLAVSRIRDAFAETADGRFAITRHLLPLDEPRPDLAATATTLLDTPYLWGGNSAFGIDCSGLVQLALQSAGLACPGDSDQQLAALGDVLPPQTPPLRNDLMFWPGHVAIVHDEDTLIHANAYHMAVAFEPVVEAIARIAAQGDGALLAHKRL